MHYTALKLVRYPNLYALNLACTLFTWKIEENEHRNEMSATYFSEDRVMIFQLRYLPTVPMRPFKAAAPGMKLFSSFLRTDLHQIVAAISAGWDMGPSFLLILLMPFYLLIPWHHSHNRFRLTMATIFSE